MSRIDILLSTIMIILIIMLVIIMIIYGSNKYIEGYFEKIDQHKEIKKKTFVYRFIKRFADIVISGMALICLSPFMLVCALLIKLEDRGPIFFKRYCIGYKKRRIKFSVFRTMRLYDDIVALGPSISEKIDPRITRIGLFLRGYGLDYIPMYTAVFLGKLTIVGLARRAPGSIPASHEDLFQYEKPGILGLSTVHNNKTDRPNTETMDLVYLKNRGILTDLRIMVYAIRNTFVSTTRSSDKQKDVELTEKVTEKQT